MHETEQIYKDEKKLKADIKQAISEYISTLLTEKNPLIGNKYYQLTLDNKEKLIKELTQEIFEPSKENINIISDETLKEQLQILTTKLLEQDEIIKQSNIVKDDNDELKDKLEQLKDSKALLIQNSNLKTINEDQSSKIANLQKSISNNEAILKQANSDAKELEKLKDMKNVYEHSAITIKQKDDEVKELRAKLQTNIDQTDSIKTLEQEIGKKDGEITTLKTNNQRLTAQNENLINQNSTLRAFKAKAIGVISKNSK
ncbi:hypothetical protein [Campylobacter majalis]|uniref:hypothetical protein n=1 Tax=Campylobacter majalis TaxID=2790656 RepID=UPI003D69F737